MKLRIEHVDFAGGSYDKLMFQIDSSVIECTYEESKQLGNLIGQVVELNIPEKVDR